MTWLFEEPEGKEFEALSAKEKYDYALGQSQRDDKDERWREIWKAIAWSHGRIKENYDACPKCGGKGVLTLFC